MSSKEKKKEKDEHLSESDEIDELNELIEKTKLQKKVLGKIIDQINKPKTKK